MFKKVVGFVCIACIEGKYMKVLYTQAKSSEREFDTDKINIAKLSKSLFSGGIGSA